jgi:hypothetical protein
VLVVRLLTLVHCQRILVIVLAGVAAAGVGLATGTHAAAMLITILKQTSSRVEREKLLM